VEELTKILGVQDQKHKIKGTSISAYAHVSEAAVGLVQIVLPEVIDYYFETRTDKASEQIKEVGHSWRSKYNLWGGKGVYWRECQPSYVKWNWRGGDGEEAAAGSGGRGDCEEATTGGLIWRSSWGGGGGGLHGEETRRDLAFNGELALLSPKWKKRSTPLASGKPVDPTCFSDFSRAYTPTNRATKWALECIFG
jgi:hypothetical protein